MNRSDYFHELANAYDAELDDLREDSEGRDVLQKRLRDKRRAFADLLAMRSFSPEMVACAFHGAFDFPPESRAALHGLLACEPGDFPPWDEVSQGVGIADWAHPLIAQTLSEEGGEDFLCTVIGLEFGLRGFSGRGGIGTADLASEDTEGTDDGDAFDDRDRGEDADERGDDEDAEALGEDFLEQQGFDRRTPP